MFETRSQAWKEVGLLKQISPRVVKRARLEVLVLLPLFVAIVAIYHDRVSLFGRDGSRPAPTTRRTSTWNRRSKRRSRSSPSCCS